LVKSHILLDFLYCKARGLWQITTTELSTNRRILVCFSVLSLPSFENVKERWVPEITHHCPKTPFLLVGIQIGLRWSLHNWAACQEQTEAHHSGDCWKAGMWSEGCQVRGMFCTHTDRPKVSVCGRNISCPGASRTQEEPQVCAADISSEPFMHSWCRHLSKSNVYIKLKVKKLKFISAIRTNALHLPTCTCVRQGA
jgi:hypothetical protein